MNTSPSPLSWKRSRQGFAAFWLLSLLAGWLLLRLVFLFAFKSGPLSPADMGRAFLAGAQRDLLVGLLVTAPLFGWLLFTPAHRAQTRWHRLLFWSGCLGFWFVQIFLLFIEYFFFEEFKSRFNTVAVDYLIYPQEVFINIWQSYHVGLILVLCLGLSVGWLIVARKLFGAMWDTPLSGKARWRLLAAVTTLLIALVATLDFKGAHISQDRTLNEIANNGAISFVAAAWTRHLDYAAFYKTLPKEEAYQRVRRLLSEPGTQFSAEGQSIQRRIPGDPTRPRLNVVLFLEESLGSEFWGCLGRPTTLTPEMDQLATEEGLLFANIYASGNRTVRGMEGVLSSFPPLPGDSIVKRDRSDNVETLARVLKRDGYSTLFLYGGRGVFDGMRSYAVRNGYDRFIEQKHFEHPTFTTIWGVCDEDLFARTVEECRALNQSGQPFFATALSVSNHKPYTYPKGRIPEDPEQRRRENAVKYSDHALGQFFRAAKKEAFWTNTLFVVVADHGARVYGSQSIPIYSYKIPLVLAGPAVVKSPRRVGQLGCSLDVAPTILGLLGRPYETQFFGRDLFQCSPANARAFLNHNRDIGMLTQDRLVVLGLMQGVEFYAGDPRKVNISLLTEPKEADHELEKDTMAVYQVADDLYSHQRYRVDSQTPLTHAAAAPASTAGPAR
ncbi:MAG TPA: LTA synthase family protein [Bacillota bacterium]|nr:LTA synthase family protein [Bacillota bacterium]